MEGHQADSTSASCFLFKHIYITFLSLIPYEPRSAFALFFGQPLQSYLMIILKTMATFWLCLLISFATLSLGLDFSQIKVPDSGTIAGVFIVPDRGSNILSFSDARAACVFLNVTIATRTQMEKALQNGLETCKFGWIDGQEAVVPRITANQNCGKGGTGLVTWKADADKTFAAFCFKAAEETTKRTTTVPQTSASPTTLRGRTQAPTATVTPPRSRTQTASSAKPLTATSALSLLAKTTRLTSQFPSTSPPVDPVSTRSSVSRPVASLATVDHSTSSTPARTYDSSVSSGSVPTQPVSSAQPPRSPGAAIMALIVVGIILLLFTAAGTMWYYKLNIWPMWSPRQQEDDIETEMWKHTDSEMDLHSPHGAEEGGGKHSSDAILSVDPHGTANPSE